MREVRRRLGSAYPASVVAVASLALLPVGAASAASTGTLSFSPATGSDAVPLTAISTGVCADPRGTNLQLQVSGHGFPGPTNVTPNLKAAIYPIDPRTGGYDVPLQDTLRDFASQQTPPVTLSGRYEFILICKRPVGSAVFNSYSGALWFSSPNSYRALTATVQTTPTATSSIASPAHPTMATSTRPAPTPSAVSSPTPTVPTAEPTFRSNAAPTRGATSAAGSAVRKPVPARKPLVTTSPPAAARTPLSSVSAAQVTPVAATAPVTASAVASDNLGPGHQEALTTALGIGALAVVGCLGLLLRRRRDAPGGPRP